MISMNWTITSIPQYSYTILARTTADLGRHFVVREGHLRAMQRLCFTCSLNSYLEDLGTCLHFTSFSLDGADCKKTTKVCSSEWSSSGSPGEKFVWLELLWLFSPPKIIETPQRFDHQTSFGYFAISYIKVHILISESSEAKLQWQRSSENSNLTSTGWTRNSDCKAVIPIETSDIKHIIHFRAFFQKFSSCHLCRCVFSKL